MSLENITVSKNITKMFGMKDNEMQGLLSGESCGGNAGHFNIGGKRYSCAAANFYFDKDNGEIYEFSNKPPKNSNNCQGIFVVAVDFSAGINNKSAMNSTIFFRIVNTMIEKGASEEAKEVLEKSAVLYNDLVMEKRSK